METSSFKPSNPRLINKIFSSLLDRIPIDADKLAKAVTCPVLIIHGAEDVPYPVENAYELYDALHNAPRQIVIVPGAPHFLSWTHAKEVNDATVKFLDGVTGIDSEAIARMPLPPSEWVSSVRSTKSDHLFRVSYPRRVLSRSDQKEVLLAEDCHLDLYHYTNSSFFLSSIY